MVEDRKRDLFRSRSLQSLPFGEPGFVIYDKEDNTYYRGGGEWMHSEDGAKIFVSARAVEDFLSDIGCDKILRDRLETLPNAAQKLEWARQNKK